jgi:hypothetical protein
VVYLLEVREQQIGDLVPPKAPGNDGLLQDLLLEPGEGRARGSDAEVT